MSNNHNRPYHGQGKGQGRGGGKYYQQQAAQQQQQYYPQDLGPGQQQFYPPGYQQPYYPQDYYQQHQQQYGQYNNGYDDYNQQGMDDPDQLMFDELEKEMNGASHQQYNQPSSHQQSSGNSFLPQGAMPTINGRLTNAAAEFWFPECRNCECCQGYKHGCKCCAGGVTQCSCVSGTSLPSPPTTTPPVAETSAPKQQSSSSYLPSGAVPTMGGKLTKAAAEFWFPECRNCECCKGYKHGCNCCLDGINTECSCIRNVSTDTTTDTSQVGVTDKSDSTAQSDMTKDDDAGR